MAVPSDGDGLHTGVLSQRAVDVAAEVGCGDCCLGGGSTGPGVGDLCPADPALPSPVVRHAAGGSEVVLGFGRGGMGDQNIAAGIDGHPSGREFCFWFPSCDHRLSAPGDAGVCQSFPGGVLFAGGVIEQPVCIMEVWVHPICFGRFNKRGIPVMGCFTCPEGAFYTSISPAFTCRCMSYGTGIVLYIIVAMAY